ncbi:Fic/DOC family protein [Sporosarcina cyprini]|uniref:Fic/DOC family protein n=1 Tax=Sporosarcina cyprini TaxID=2910523 RepID=UPI001EDD7B3E|nr:Fic family protein [Sporosarcina cyprini]MCG3088379.1 Fic family protein [Sporosarcina cyprini]
MDPYLYGDVPVLRNRLGIKDESELITVEAQILIANLLNFDTALQIDNIFDVNAIRLIHQYLFGDLYDWAGDFRTVDIFKEEKVLDGQSVMYSRAKSIKESLTKTLDWAFTINWDYTNPSLTSCFAELMARLWRVHPFREGNTRTISVYMKLFSKYHQLSFNDQLLSQNSSYLRAALVMASIDEYSETQYLERIIGDALSSSKKLTDSISTSTSTTYKVIKSHIVDNDEEIPFSVKDKE